eukprot:6533711-Prymnesium_polylepis.1
MDTATASTVIRPGTSTRSGSTSRASTVPACARTMDAGWPIVSARACELRAPKRVRTGERAPADQTLVPGARPERKWRLGYLETLLSGTRVRTPRL